MSKFEDIYNKVINEKEEEKEVKGEMEDTAKEDGIKIVIEYFRYNEEHSLEGLRKVFEDADIPAEKCDAIVVDMLKSFWKGGKLAEKLKEDEKIVEALKKDQLEKGIKIEIEEHFLPGYAGKKMAEKIAMDHLAEGIDFPYYDKLVEMEEGRKAE